MSGFGSRRDHQGARGGVGGTSQEVDPRGGSVGGWIETSEFSAARGGRSLRAATTYSFCRFCKRVGRIEGLCPSKALQVERDDLREDVEGRPRNARSLAVPSPDLVMGDNSMQSPSVLAIRSGCNSSIVGPSLTNQIRVSSRTIVSIQCRVASNHFGEVRFAGDPCW